MGLSVCVLGSVSVGACVALDYRYSFDEDFESKYNDEIFDKNTKEDTMEFMDELKVWIACILLVIISNLFCEIN